ncbi:MAG TPA: hypothetical protein VM056_04650 [Terriglobales bacterium]|nr:hypothetical protein [Terriglobales bacterium]
MSIIHQVSAITATRKAVLRECPACKEKQQAAPSKAKLDIKCKKCGAVIPPNQK